MNAAENPQIEQLLDASARDERTLDFPIDEEIFGFHAQQAVEKLLKALITAHGERHPFTHDLSKLVIQLSMLGEVILLVPPGWDDLTDYALDVRYASGAEFPSPMRDEVRSAIAALRIYVLKRVDELKKAGVQVREP